MTGVARTRTTPGRRRAAPSRRRDAGGPTKDLVPTPAPAPYDGRRASRRRSPTLLFGIWLVVVVAGLALCVAPWAAVELPREAPLAGAVLVTTSYAVGLAARTGGRRTLSALVAGGLSIAAVVWRQPVLLSGVAVGTAALGGVLGVLATTPAPRYRHVVREVVVAAVVAAVAAFAVEAYQAPVALDRAVYLALGVALLGAVGLVYRLGAGLAGLGRRGVVGVGVGILLLFVGLAYSEALARWGSGELNTRIDELITDVHDTLGAVPRPTQFLLGFPALAWGVSTRARRRQGWWVCSFGAAGLAVVSTSLLNPRMSLVEAALVLGYGLLIGLPLGYAAIRADSFLTGTRGRRARRLEELAAHRPEPRRYEPLL